MFAYMLLDKNLDWYRKILEQALDKQKSLFLNPKNCIGTVLSLNGFRKYFCVYHAKHMEMQSNVSWIHFRKSILVKPICYFELQSLKLPY